MFERSVLPNGLRILVTPMSHTRSVSLGFFIGVGSRYETDDLGGAAHFIEHMLFKGTEKRPSAADLAEAIEGIGGIINAGTGRELTNYWVKVSHAHVNTALDVLVDMLRRSLIQPDEVERERQVITEEIKMTLDTPDELVQMALSELQWQGNPAGRDIAGTRESVAELTRDQLLQHMALHYGPANTVLAIAGNVTLQAIVDAVREALSDWEGGAGGQFVPYLDGAQSIPRVRSICRPTEQANLALSVPGLARSDPERYVLRMLNAVLGEGMCSRLFQEIREKRGLAYSVDSYIETLHETGVIGVYAGVDPDKAEQTLAAVLSEWDRLRQEPVPQDELNRAREFAKGRLLLRLEDTFAVAAWNGQQELLQGEVMSPEAVIAEMDAVTPDDVQRMAQRLLDPGKISLAVVGPFGSEQEPDVERFHRILSQ